MNDYFKKLKIKVKEDIKDNWPKYLAVAGATLGSKHLWDHKGEYYNDVVNGIKNKYKSYKYHVKRGHEMLGDQNANTNNK